jgi:hypothetical protein
VLRLRVELHHLQNLDNLSRHKEKRILVSMFMKQP